MEDFWLSLMPKNSSNRFWYTLDAAVSSWESAVDMVAARIPARITPAVKARNTPFFAIRSDSWMTMVSASALVVRKGILPAADTL